MEGTVNWASREDGRPVFWGTAAGTGVTAGTGTGLLTACVAGSGAFALGEDLTTGLLIFSAAFTGFTGAFAIGLATGLEVGLTGALGLVCFGTVGDCAPRSAGCAEPQRGPSP